MRYIGRIAITLSLFSLILLSSPRVSFAAPVEVTADAPAAAIEAVNDAKDVTKTSLGGTIFMYLLNLMTFAADRLAYDAAVMIASGGPSEEPLYDGRPAEVFFKQYGAAVAGEAVGLLQDDLTSLSSQSVLAGVLSNFNLCSPNADVVVSISLGIKSVFQRPQPKCDIRQIQSNWNGFLADLQNENQQGKNSRIISELANMYDPQTNEFSVGLSIYSDVFSRVVEESQLATMAHIKADGFQPVADFITGNVETPADLVKEEYLDAQAYPKQVGNQALLALVGNPDALLQVGIHAGSVFTNTLLSEFTKKLYEGLFDFDVEFPDPFGDIETIARGNAESARNQFRSFLRATPLEITNYSILAEFSSCPTNNRGLYNCVVNSSFVSAIARADAGAAMTLGEALEDGLINGNWPLIPSSDRARNQDPYCYTYGFCHANLVKLRKARVIPVGWEMAAESRFNSSDAPVTLQQVVDGFDDCNPQGEPDDNHPWCKLVDPAWVLKYPEQQCKALVYGQLLETDAGASRQQECVDMPSCIAEGDDGSCVGGYGYCVAEENTWRFRGESCPEQFASCLTFDGDEKTVSYLQTTLDFADCNEQHAGCLWYSTEKADPEGDGTFDWQPVDDIALADADPEAYQSRIYFTDEVEECSGEAGGCRELVARNDELRLNVLKNPSFEDDADRNNVPDGWLFTNNAASVVDTSATYSRSGSDAVQPGNGNFVFQPSVAFSQGRFYTLSFYARQNAAGAGTGRALIAFEASDASQDVDLRGTSITGPCVIGNTNNAASGDGLNDLLTLTATPAGTSHERFTCTFTSPILEDAAVQVSAFVSISGDAFIDDLQLEQGADVSGYHVGYSDVSLAKVTVKVPPAYLGCRGEESDPAECANYAQVCSEAEIGCTMYSPTNGDPAVTGIVTALDVCPSICVGYDTFKQEPTLYEPEGLFPVYFIPETGEECSEEAVGCDEFTNLTTEAKEYYTYLRACVTPEQADANINDDQAATFYTWEGSDLEGYQLRTWNLLESNQSQVAYTYADSGEQDTTPHLAPCSIWSATADGIVCSDTRDADGDLVNDWDTAGCDEHDDIFTNPDCREFYDANGGIHYRLWSKTVTVNAACESYRKTVTSGLDIDAQQENCTASGGFWDGALGSCRYYGYTEESIECDESENGCRSYTGGRSRNSRVVVEDLFEGTLSAWDVDSAATATLSNESLATGGHSIAATDAFASFVYDYGKECTDEVGCAGTAQSLGGTCTVVAGERYCGTLEGELFKGKTYTVSFWAKGTGTLSVGFDQQTTAGAPKIDISFGDIAVNNEWQEYNLGPLDITQAGYPNFGAGTTLVFDPSALTYIDNIVLREGEDNITVLKNSWQTPAACDQTPTGTPSPQYHLGCQEYTTHEDEVAYVKSFSKLCDSNKVGCEDFFMTQESESPHAQVFNATCANPSGLPVQSPTSCYYQADAAGNFVTTSQYLCTIGVGLTNCTFNADWFVNPESLPTHLSYGSSATVVPADTDVFLVVNDDVTCSGGDAGCQEVGNVLWSADRNSTTGADSVFLMNDPDQYGEILCDHDDLFCAAWDTDDAGTFYFKDPIDQTCEYRTNVTVNGSTYDGWFRTGTSEFCYGTCSNSNTACSTDAQCGSGTCDTSDPSYVINGDFSGIWRNGDDTYNGWVGTCDTQYSSCSEFQDPLDVASDEAYGSTDGEQYFYLNNANLDQNSLPSSQRCDGRVSLKEGCVLFNDTSKTSQGFSASATDVASMHADVLFGEKPFDLVEPINCESGDSTIRTADGSTVDLCAQRCIYDLGEINDISDGQKRNAKLNEEDRNNANNGALYGFDDIYIAGTSCYSVTDCGTIRSESGDDIEAVACDTQARVTKAAASLTGADEYESVPRLENDTNTVLKVNRDRQCSEWLTCANAQEVWDERSNSYKTVCGDVELCEEYSTVGGKSFCSKWKFNEPEVLLTEEVYTDRDVSWYGKEYSGFAIPNLYPVQTLSQANVAPPPGTCDLSDELASGAVTKGEYNAKHGEICTADTDCVTTSAAAQGMCRTADIQDYRLVLDAGSCDESFGANCSVGYCKNTGAACASTSDCGLDGGSCLVGSCQLDTGTPCSSDAQCGSDQICSGGSCIEPGGDVTVEDYERNGPNACPGDEVLSRHDAFKVGSCIRGQCLLTPDGYTFEEGEAEAKLCRGYPEQTSPFSEDLVELWVEPVPEIAGLVPQPSESTSDWDGIPYDIRSGFENANFCVQGQDCLGQECSYNKVTFGSGQTRYFEPDFSVYNSENPGLCTVGRAGANCRTNSDCNYEDIVGRCEFPTREDKLLGLPGYCLEKDSSININGDTEQQACITWLPIDQLAGSTDMYAKYTEAGYFVDTYACTYTAPFVDLKISNHPSLNEAGEERSMACAELGGGVGPDEVDTSVTLSACAANVACPAGYWAMMSMPHWDNNGLGTMADACVGRGLANNDCAYVCVPNGATTFVDNSEESCGPGSDYVQGKLDEFVTGDEWARQYTSNSGTEVKVVASNANGDRAHDTPLYFDFDEMVDALSSCSTKGVRYTQVIDDEVRVFQWQVGMRNLYPQMEFYLGCDEVTQLVDGSKSVGYPWTDRLLGPNAADYTVVSETPGMEYVQETKPEKYGFIKDNPASLSDSWPLVVAACYEEGSDSLVQPVGGTDLNSCDARVGQVRYTEAGDSEYYDLTVDYPSAELIGKTDPQQAKARSLIGFRFGGNWQYDDWEPDGTIYDIFGIVKQLFASPDLGSSTDANKYKWNAGADGWPNQADDRTYTGGDIGDFGTNYDIAEYDVRGSEGRAPKVWSIDTANCLSGTECQEEEENEITVNDQNGGDQDAYGFFGAYVKFYAAADKNQLPIRRVIVDWGDQDGIEDMTGSITGDNMYKNHRGVDPVTNKSYCASGDEWGMTEESCDPNFFTYSHVYTCSPSITTVDSRVCQRDPDTGNLLNAPCWIQNGPDVRDRACAFQPRVHIRDNWGWCAGECTLGADGKSECFENSVDTLSLPGSTLTQAECAYQTWPDAVLGPQNDPWVYYDGLIIVDPDQE